jgi:hypothetical protein
VRAPNLGRPRLPDLSRSHEIADRIARRSTWPIRISGQRYVQLILMAGGWAKVHRASRAKSDSQPPLTVVRPVPPGGHTMAWHQLLGNHQNRTSQRAWTCPRLNCSPLRLTLPVRKTRQSLSVASSAFPPVISSRPGPRRRRPNRRPLPPAGESEDRCRPVASGCRRQSERRYRSAAVRRSAQSRAAPPG